MAHDNATRRRYQFLVYWEATGKNDLGEYTFASPRELKVRIEEGLRETIDPEGNTVASAKQINVPESIVIGSLIWVGKLKDLPTSPAPEIHQVINHSTVPNVRARKYDRWIDTMRHSSKVPVLT